MGRRFAPACRSVPSRPRPTQVGRHGGRRRLNRRAAQIEAAASTSVSTTRWPHGGRRVLVVEEQCGDGADDAEDDRTDDRGVEGLHSRRRPAPWAVVAVGRSVLSRSTRIVAEEGDAHRRGHLALGLEQGRRPAGVLAA